MSNPPDSQVVSYLEYSVRALAQPFEIQMGLFPHFVCVADELALDFDECYQRFVKSACAVDTQAAAALVALDKHLECYSGEDNAHLWTDEALRDAPEWEKTRQLAQLVITLLNWSHAPPPRDRAIYVGPDS